MGKTCANGWVNFTKEKTSEGFTYNQRKEMWSKMTDDEKKKYGGPDKDGKPVKIMCSLSQFAQLVKNSKLDSTVELLDSPFAFLLKLTRYELDDDLIFKVVSGFNPIEKSLKIGDKSLKIVSKDFDHILKIGKEDAVTNESYNPTDDMARRFLSGGHVCMKKIKEILLKKKDVDDLKRAFALASLRYVVCPPSNGRLGQRYLKYVENVDGLKKQPWAGLAMRSLMKGISSFQNPRGDATTYLGGSMVFLQLYYLNQVTNKSPEELIYDSKESITSLVKSNEGIMIEKQNKEEDTTSNTKNFRRSEVRRFVKELCHDYFNCVANYMKGIDDIGAIPLLKVVIEEMHNKVRTTRAPTVGAEGEYDTDTTRVGPFKVRTTQAPTVDDCKLLELCFEKVSHNRVVAGVVDNEAFRISRKHLDELMPGCWISNKIINCVVDILCVRECINGNYQRWFFPLDMRKYRINSKKRSRATHYVTKLQLQFVKQIFFPVYDAERLHFYLIVFNNLEEQVEVWDTLKKDIQIYMDTIELLSQFLDDEIEDALVSFKQYTPILIDVPQQGDTYDCGIFVCRSMEFPDDVMKFHTDKWISEEERCNLAVRILKANENVYSEFLVEENCKSYSRRRLNTRS